MNYCSNCGSDNGSSTVCYDCGLPYGPSEKEHAALQAKLEAAVKKGQYFLEDNQRLKGELERSDSKCDSLQKELQLERIKHIHPMHEMQFAMDELQKENEQLKKVLGVIALDIGSTHAATKAKEALSALVKEGQ